MSGTNGWLQCGDIARLTGVSPDTIRHYERIGVLPLVPRTSSGYRMYDNQAIERVHLVRRALRLGFTLPELSEILRVRDEGGAPCRRVLALTEEKLRSLEQQIKELQQTQRYMKTLVRQWRQKLQRAKPGSKVMLLQSLPAESVNSIANSSRRKRP